MPFLRKHEGFVKYRQSLRTHPFFSLQFKAELRQVQLKLSDSSKNCSSLTSQWELSRQKVKELELELLKHSQATKQQSSLQEKLMQEKAKAAEAENRVRTVGGGLDPKLLSITLTLWGWQIF